MKVKKLIKELQKLDGEAVIDMASDEEGNSFGDVGEGVAEGKLKDGRKVYSLYPKNNEMAEERYITNSLCLDCLEEMEIETDIQLCQKCMKNYDTDLLWKRHDNNELDALDFNKSPKMREEYRL